MTKTQIVLIIAVAAVVGVIISQVTGMSTSVGFAEAFDNPGKEFKISGTLDRSQPVEYFPEQDTERTVFYMADKNNQTQKVNLRKAKPTGLEQSETIDLYGKVIDGEFHATDILMKCPSKYNEHNHSLETADTAEY
jgi:cytochrome c-type biogenesis protein CcmE